MLQATIDCVEAILRCLSHLTSSHQLANEALHQLTYEWTDFFLAEDKGVCWILDLLHFTSHEGMNVCCEDHAIQAMPEQWDALDVVHIFQLTKAWLSLARNRLAGGVWQSMEQEMALRSAVVHLEKDLLPFTESVS